MFSGTNSQRSESAATSDNSNTDSDSDSHKYDQNVDEFISMFSRRGSGVEIDPNLLNA